MILSSQAHQRPSPRWRRLILAAGLVLTLAGTALLQPVGLGSTLDHALLDRLLAATALAGPASGVAVVDIDDASLAAVGQWPWPRYRTAALVKRVGEGRPAAIGLDILFAEPDRTSLATLQQAFERDFGIQLAISGAPPAMRDNDAYLAATLAALPVVGARYFRFDGAMAQDRTAERAANGPLAATADPELEVTGQRGALQPPLARGVIDNTPPLAAALGRAGFINMSPDADGLLRRLPLFIALPEPGRAVSGASGPAAAGNAAGAAVSLHPQLALAAQLEALGLGRVDLQAGPPPARAGESLAAAAVRRLGLRDGPRLQVGDRQLPLDGQGRLLLRFRQSPASAYARVAAVDLLAGRVDPALFNGRLVFIGSSAAGLEDHHATAVGEHFPGLQVLAAVGDMLQTGEVAALPPAGSLLPATLCLATGLLMSLAFALLRSPLMLLAAATSLAAGVCALSLMVWQAAAVYLSPLPALALLAALYTVFMLARFLIERQLGRRWLDQLANARQVTLESMAAVAETRDPETGAHIKRTQAYVQAIALRLRAEGHYTEQLSDAWIALLHASAPLHDIGKVGVPDHILLKPERLLPEEFVHMKKHAVLGQDILRQSARGIEGDNFLAIAGEIAATHHEKWDGSGYPMGLAGEAIPLSGRIMAVADVYDALISRRCYKPAFSHGEAMRLMAVDRGKGFDPRVYDAFLAIEPEIIRIAATWRDEHELVMGDR
ncbi:MAG: hypothetical protein RL722_588 [Pseudomonadota bacterium]